jgi:isopentenyl-diphosphate delta-isomerase type 1
MEEIFPIVTENGDIVGSATRSECHSGGKLLHPVVHLHVFNNKGELLLQKRSMNKDIQPGKWDTSVGGHIDFGEKPEDALIREAHEELGIESFKAEPLRKYIYESEIERELVYSFKTVWEKEIHFDPNEIDEVRFFSFHEIESLKKSKSVTPNFIFEYEWLQKNIIL